MDYEFDSKSNFDHYATRIATSGTEILAVGSDLGHAHTELYDVEKQIWSTQDDYPFHERISVAPILYIKQVFLMFGGFGGGDTDTIAQFDPLLLKWAQVGQLARKRHSANAIEGLLFRILYLLTLSIRHVW